MNSQFTRVVRIKLYKIIGVLLMVATAVCTYFYYTTSEKKLEAILSGLVTGLLVAIIQYFLDWNEHAEVEAIKRLGIKHILPTRDDKNHYRKLIEGARKEIWVLGNTASRMLEDFAHVSREDSRALTEALSRGVLVRILLPESNQLGANDRSKADEAKRRLKELASKHKNLKARFFNHPPNHSLMKIDNDCMVGPIFPDVRSKDSPTIHVYADSPLINEYLKYFESEWSNAST